MATIDAKFHQEVTASGRVLWSDMLQLVLEQSWLLVPGPTQFVSLCPRPNTRPRSCRKLLGRVYSSWCGS